jgi:hypothetical protein
VTTTLHGKPIAAKDLQLGDTIRLGDGAFMDAVVQQIENGRAHLERPYMVVADFSYTGGVITSIGHENWTVSTDDNRTYILLTRRILK